MSELNDLVQLLRKKVDEVKFVDVGKDAARTLGVSILKLKTALATLRNEGYNVHSVVTKQSGTDTVVILRVLTLPDARVEDTHEALKLGTISSL